MVAKDEAGKSVPVPGLILNSEDSVRRFVRSISRQSQAKQRSEIFNVSEFKVGKHKDHDVKTIKKAHPIIKGEL